MPLKMHVLLLDRRGKAGTLHLLLKHLQLTITVTKPN